MDMWNGTTKSRMLQTLLILLFKCCLDLSYATWISRKYAYLGLTYSLSIPCLIATVPLVLLSAMTAVRLLERGGLSDISVSLLIIIYYLPSATMFALSNHDPGYFLFVTLYFIFLIGLNRVIHFPTYSYGYYQKSDALVYVAIVLSVLMIAISGYYSGFRISINLSEFYDLRSEAREYSMPSVVSYLFNWARYIIPVGILYTVLHRKKGLTIFFSVTQILAFSFNGKKSSLAFFLIALGMGYFYRSRYLKTIPFAFASLGVLGVIEPFVRGGESAIGKFLLRRAMIIPAWLGRCYYDYFSSHGYDFLRGSVLGFLGFESPYGNIPRLIGSLYYKTSNALKEVNANTGMCGDAFANFGWLSLFIYPLMVILILKAMEMCSDGLEKPLIHFIALLCAYMLINGSFFKILLTNGFLVLLPLLFTSVRGRSGTKEVSSTHGDACCV